MVEPVEPKLESERTTTEQKSGGVSILAANSFFNEFVDCMQNLPNRLQVLLTDLSTIDALVKKRHQTLELIKQELKKRTGNNTPSSSTSTVEPSGEFAIEKSMYESFRLEQLLAKLHQTLIESQHLGDQKLRVTSQIIETICNRTRQIGLDCKSNDERKFNFEINEDRIVSEFKQAVRKTRPLYPTNGFYPTTSSALAAAAAAANSSSQTASASRASARNSNSNNQLINNANLNNYSKHYQSPVKQASSQSLSNCGSPSTTTLALSVHHHHHHHHHKRRRVHEDNDDESAATPGSQQHLKALSLNNAAVNQCRSPSSMSTTSTCSTSGRKPNYVLVSRANKIQHLKKQRKSEEPAPVKKNDRKLGRKLKPAKRMKKTQKMNKKMNGHKEDDENENDLGAEGDNDEDDEEDDEEDDVSLSNDEIEFGAGAADLDDEDEARENTRKPKTPQQQQRYSRRRDSEEDDSNNSSVGGAAGDKIDSDVDMAELKPPNSSSNETESIKQLDDDENDFAASKNNTTEKENNKTNETSTNTTTNNNNNNSENGNNMESSSSSSIKKKRAAITTTPNNNGNKQNANSDNNTSGGGGGGASVSSSSHRQLNEDEPVYCLCREISYGQMILCDNDACKIEWFHFQCVKLASKPKGKWYCPKCRGDSHRVMKKSHQTHLNTSSSTSMASPSHYSNYSSSSYSTRNK